MVVCEHHMKLQNDAKRRKLNGFCDYSICHRGHINLPHLVAIEAKKTVKEALLQCIGECASIHYRRKVASMRHQAVYGIHSTGSSWYFIFIDESGVVYLSKEFKLCVENYVEDEVSLIYSLVHYVIHQSHRLSAK